MSLLLVGFVSGCASPRSYFVDRGRDAADIVSVSVGEGYGAKARVSALSFGMLYDGSVAGLRNGTRFSGKPGDYAYDVQFFFCVNEYFEAPGSNERLKRFRAKQDYGLDFDQNTFGEGVWCLVPPFCLGPMVPVFPEVTPPSLSYYTEVEVAVGLFGSLRFGFNPGELVDFLLGWTTVDFMKDDLEQAKLEKKP